MLKIKVGKFILGGDGGITGPADYMNERFDTFMEGIEHNHVFNFTPSMKGLLVAVQTDYAGWRGRKLLHSEVFGGKK